MAEELQRHGIKFSLDLNKHPKDATNLSLINAENFKVSEDGSTLISDKTLEENTVIKNKLSEYYGDNPYNIIFCIPTNDEIVLFVTSNYITNKYYDLDLFRYSEKLDVCSDSIIPSEYEKMKYYGGKFSGTFTYNVKNELIITFCEYDSFYPTYLNYGEPLKTINLGYFDIDKEGNYYLNISSNLNPKTFPICPEVDIPSISNWSIINGLSKKGWYHFYIRYKINKYDYTQWFSFGRAFYLDDSEEKTIFKYKSTTETATNPNEPVWSKTAIISNDGDICQKSIQFELYNLSNIYESYQIAFICNTKIYTECKITNDLPITSNTYILSYKDCKDYDYNNLLKIYENYYSVKNIINYNNRLYISNYKTSKKLNYDNTISHKIVDVTSSTEDTDNVDSVVILFNNEQKLIKLNNNKISIKELFGVDNLYIYNKISSTISNEGTTNDDEYYYSAQYSIFDTNNLFFTSENFKTFRNVYKCSGLTGWSFDWFDEIENNNTLVTGTFNQHVRDSWMKNYYIDYVEYNNLINISDYEFTFDKNTNRLYCNELDSINNCISIIGNNDKKDNHTPDGRHIGIYYELIAVEYDVKNEYISSDNKEYNEDNNYNFTLIDKQPYNFFIHYVDKYGYINDGLPINIRKSFLESEGLYTTIHEFNGEHYIYFSNNVIKESDNKITNVFIYVNLNSKYSKSDTYIDETVIKNNAIFYVNLLKGEPVYEFKTFDELKNNRFIVYERNVSFIDAILYYFSNMSFNLYLSNILNEDDVKNKTFKEIITIYPYIRSTGYSINFNNNSIIIPNITEYDSSKGIKFNNIIIPYGYNSYFISYEKLEKTLLYTGICVQDTENNIKALFYSDSLNYKDTIDIGVNIDKKLNKLKDIEYKIANSIEDNNEGKSTNLELIFENEIEDGITYLYKIPNTYYESNNKNLIRISEFSSNPSISITTYGFKTNISPIVINDAFRINSANKLIHYDNTDTLDKNPFKKLDNFQVVSYTPDNSKQINNPPKIYKTIINEVNYDNPKAEFYNSYLFLPQDTIDLFKNNALDYDESCLSIYSNYNENNINQTEFIKTIRRSTFIKDESLENGWRSFETEAYQNIQENKGEITRIEGIGDLLLVHTKDSLFQFDKSNLLMTTNKNVQLAQGDTFDVGYKEIFTSSNGYGGLQDKDAAIVGEFGYIWYNNDFNKIYQYNAGSLNVISGNIEFLLNKYKPTTCRFVDDKQNKRLIIQFQLKPVIVDGIEKTQILNLTYNYDIKAFISFYKDYALFPDMINETYNTKTKFYILESDKAFSGFSKCNATKLSFIINENYSKIKRLNFIKYKLYKRIDSSNDEFNANLPVEGNAMSMTTSRTPYSGFQLRVYNDLCDTGILDIYHDIKIGTSDKVKPYYDLGNFTFNNLRDKDNKNQIFGNFFIVEFIFEPKIDQEDGVIEFESLEYSVSYEEN